MMGESYCSIHGNFTMTTVPGCPKCAYINAAPQTFGQAFQAGTIAPQWPPWAEREPPTGFVDRLLHERDRFRDALQEIQRTIDQDVEVANGEEVIEEVGRIVKKSMAVPQSGTAEGEKR